MRLIGTRRALATGLPHALRHVGIARLDGDGVKRDPELGLRELSQAADMGDPAAMRTLGFFYCGQHGGNRDSARAMQWFQKAADTGDPAALVGWALEYEGGVNVVRDRTNRLR